MVFSDLQKQEERKTRLNLNFRPRDSRERIVEQRDCKDGQRAWTPGAREQRGYRLGHPGRDATVPQVPAVGNSWSGKFSYKTIEAPVAIFVTGNEILHNCYI